MSTMSVWLSISKMNEIAASANDRSLEVKTDQLHTGLDTEFSFISYLLLINYLDVDHLI